jgi:hypothetical protein
MRNLASQNIFIIAIIVFVFATCLTSKTLGNDENGIERILNPNFVAYNRYGVRYTTDDPEVPPYKYHPVLSIDDMGKKACIRFTSPCFNPVQNIWIYSWVEGAPGQIKVSLKDDNGAGYPVKESVPESTVTTITKGWQQFALDISKTLWRGKVYHIVVEPENGTFDSNNYLELIASVSRQPIPFQPYCKSSQPISYYDLNLSYLFDDGQDMFIIQRHVFSIDLMRAINPIFAVEYDDGTVIGQPYDTHEEYSISRNDYFGQAIELEVETTINYVAFFVCGETHVRPADHLWFDLYSEVNGNVIPIIQNVKLIDKNAIIYSQRTHWFGTMIPSTIKLAPKVPYYFVLKSPGSYPSAGYKISMERSTLSTAGLGNVPTFFMRTSYGIYSSDAGITFQCLDEDCDTGFLLGHLEGDDPQLPIAVFDEMNVIPTTAKEKQILSMPMTNRNIGAHGNIYARLYDYDTMKEIGLALYDNVPSNEEKNIIIDITMPAKDLRILVECGHFINGLENVVDDFVPLDIRLPVDLNLHANKYTISASTGSAITFTLTAAIANANRNYFLLGSATGTEPGLQLPLVKLPLNWDVFTDTVISLANTPTFAYFNDTLDALGNGSAQFNTMGPFHPSAVGATLYFTYLLYYPIDFASNPVAIEVLP